jgi:hypothetical protein
MPLWIEPWLISAPQAATLLEARGATRTSKLRLRFRLLWPKPFPATNRGLPFSSAVVDEKHEYGWCLVASAATSESHGLSLSWRCERSLFAAVAAEALSLPRDRIAAAAISISLTRVREGTRLRLLPMPFPSLLREVYLVCWPGMLSLRCLVPALCGLCGEANADVGERDAPHDEKPASMTVFL